MNRNFLFAYYPGLLTSALLLAFSLKIQAQDGTADLLKKYQYNLSDSGRQFLLRQAEQASFFMLGELHGEREIPELLYSLWPDMQHKGYNHVAAELSPWAAQKLEFSSPTDTAKIFSLWSAEEARFIHANAAERNEPSIWGCDMEEISLAYLLSDLARENPDDPTIKTVLERTVSGYTRKLSPELLRLFANYKPAHDKFIQGVSLYKNIISSLRIDSARMFPVSRVQAQLLREHLMKEYFITRYKHLKKEEKIFVRFGRNHLHRGFDERGISTLGNFISEFAISEDLTSFNVACFAASGHFTLAGRTFDADERRDDLAFQFFYEQARYQQTIFDLRPLRSVLHGIKPEQRTDLHHRLRYWADSYDAIICYKTVTPFTH